MKKRAFDCSDVCLKKSVVINATVTWCAVKGQGLGLLICKDLIVLSMETTESVGSPLLVLCEPECENRLVFVLFVTSMLGFNFNNPN